MGYSTWQNVYYQIAAEKISDAFTQWRDFPLVYIIGKLSLFLLQLASCDDRHVVTSAITLFDISWDRLMYMNSYTDSFY